MKSVFKIIEEERLKGNRLAWCTVVSTQGSTPLKSGAKMLVTEKGAIFGTIGGGNLEKKVIENAYEVLKKKECKLFQHNLLQQHGMCCGGSVQIYIESVMPNNKLYVFGAGHVGRALAEYAAALSFDVFVIDSRKEELDKITNHLINKLTLNHDQLLPSLPFDEHAYIAIMTYDHQIDREILAFCLKKSFAYLGMIGSERKVEITKKMFLSTQMFCDDELSKVDMPMGFDIRGNEPNEIAIGILAKIIEVKNKRATEVNKKSSTSEFKVERSNESFIYKS